MNKRNKMMKRIESHGNTLLVIFPDATEQDPVKLSKMLRRLEVKARREAEAYCNGRITCDQWELTLNDILAKLNSVLRPTGAEGVFINADARGYALKLDSEFTHGFNGARWELGEPCIHRDLGGCGILAPDLSE